ncbi:MAG: class I SAM-dependent methyltransferase [Candidatus Gracilibacteria bacterium]|nr:class I SAM-dependent methyltransferase [Candidatus Gracilibacteria bacterium]
MSSITNITEESLRSMSYVDFMAHINETNRCPGGKDSVRQLMQNTFLNSESKVLDVGCNTGYVSFEIGRTIKCDVTGLDINENMVAQSKNNNTDPIASKYVDFVVGDGQSLPFPDNSFDLVTSGGSTIFIPNLQKGLTEYKRVCKDWGFIGDINFFYGKEVPTKTIAKINELLGIDIQPWNIDFFLNLYESVGLEKYHIYTGETHKPTKEELKMYCKEMIQNSQYGELSRELQDAAFDKFYEYMELFYENNRYLSYGVFIYRKRPEEYKEQISLFGY